MKVHQAFIHGERDLRIDQVDISDEPLGPDELLVQTEVSALSTGTDIGNFVGDSRYIPMCPGYPRSIGYSNVGVVLETGTNVHEFRPGQRVFSTKRHVSKYRAVKSDLLIAVPETVSSDAASLSYLAQLTMSALRQADYISGERVAIVGLGVIGLTGIAIARALGAKTIAIGNSPLRQQVAEKVGAHHTISSDEKQIEEVLRKACSGDLADIVILSADKWSAYRTAMSCVRFAGRVAILGFPGRWEGAPPFNPLDPAWFWAKRLSILGSGFDTHRDCELWERRFTTRRNLEYIIDLLANGALALEPIITHRVPVAQMQQIYDLAASHSKDLITAVFDWKELQSE
jgi:threonine dehydrogenase-like Zn-dependent dehydrogenase